MNRPETPNQALQRTAPCVAELLVVRRLANFDSMNVASTTTPAPPRVNRVRAFWRLIVRHRVIVLSFAAIGAVAGPFFIPTAEKLYYSRAIIDTSGDWTRELGIRACPPLEPTLAEKMEVLDRFLDKKAAKLGRPNPNLQGSGPNRDDISR